jgi:hypothetical protein
MTFTGYKFILLRKKWYIVAIEQGTCQSTSTVYKIQCCGSVRILTGSGSDFRKRPDPDPDPNKFSANFFLNFFKMKICSKKYRYLHEPKSKTTEIPEVSLALNILKKLRYGHLLGQGSGSGSKKVRIRPDPDPQH